MDIAELMKKIQQCLTPDLLKKEYRAENSTNPMFGHCYVASEVLFHSIQSTGGYSAACGRDDRGIVHWWIVDNLTGEIHDVTSDQYYSKGIEPPYNAGRKTGFLTKHPSKRAQIVLARIANHNKKINRRN
jgi:hypothetical protein